MQSRQPHPVVILSLLALVLVLGLPGTEPLVGAATLIGKAVALYYRV